MELWALTNRWCFIGATPATPSINPSCISLITSRSGSKQYQILLNLLSHLKMQNLQHPLMVETFNILGKTCYISDVWNQLEKIIIRIFNQLSFVSLTKSVRKVLRQDGPKYAVLWYSRAGPRCAVLWYSRTTSSSRTWPAGKNEKAFFVIPYVVFLVY